MNGTDLECYESMQDILSTSIDENPNDPLDAFASAVRSNRFLVSSVDIDQYIIAGAFILLTKRSKIPVCDYWSWALPAAVLMWFIMEDSYQLLDEIDATFDPSRTNEVRKRAFELAVTIGWNIHINAEELEEVLGLLRTHADDVLRTREKIPEPFHQC